MKICIISGDAVGGLRKHVHDLLMAAPYDAELLYIHSDVTDAAAKNDFISLIKMGIKRLPLRIAKNPAVSDFKNIVTIWRVCRKEGIDIIHGHSAKGGLYSRVVGLLLRKPVIYTPHGGSVHARFGKAKSLLFATVEYLLKYATTLFIFESHYTSSAFQQLAGNIPETRKLINYNGINHEHFIPVVRWPGKEGRAVQLLVVGMLTKVKGQDVAINATAILKSRGWQVSLNLCGDGEDRTFYESLVVSSQLDECVRFNGDVSDVRVFYENCDIVIIPSRFESFGYVAVEAALMGRPVVASDTGGLLETVVNGQTGLSYSTGNPVALANAIEQTFENVEITRRRITLARARADELFDVRQMTARVYSIYRQLLN
jgi:glycosyltransferase involved in cell wall biosynthesis